MDRFPAHRDGADRGEGGGPVKDHIGRRVLDIGRYIARTRATVREAARVFGVSKSTVHKDLTERLPRLDPILAARVKQVLETNKAERHLRGGEATRLKYLGEGQPPRSPAP
jgi:putative DeoR family transcriptional regulator (stage III sporulation protein D)